MAEHDRNRSQMDEPQELAQQRNAARGGGIARSDTDLHDLNDVTPDPYSNSVDAGDPDHETTDRDAPRAGEVLGIGRDVPADRRTAPGGSDERRRRRADDLVERREVQDPSGVSYEGPDGLKVRG